jgi:hypothetical protein
MNLNLTPSNLAVAYLLAYLPALFGVIIFLASVIVYGKTRKLGFLFLCAGCGVQVVWSVFASWGLLFYHVQQAHPFAIRCIVDVLPILPVVGWVLLAREKLPNQSSDPTPAQGRPPASQESRHG